MCFRCKKPYFGGMPSCEEAARGDEDYNPEDLVCGACAGNDLGDTCAVHGAEFIEFKCQVGLVIRLKLKFCCSVASWYCWGKTHFCDDCHAQQVKGNYLTRKPKNNFAGKQVAL